jgi:histidyl-tRNA synthetase
MSSAEFETLTKELVGDGVSPLTAITTAADKVVLEEKEKLQTFIATLKERGITNVVYDPTLVRGFDYYTGVIFEFFDTDPSNTRSLFGGGRYDNLLSLFSNDSIPAVGFAVGDVTLQDFLETHELLPEVSTGADVYLATPALENIAAAQLFADELREQGLTVFVNLLGKKIGDQIKDAEKRKISVVIVYGEDEAKSTMVTVKNIVTGKELETKKDNVADLISEL